MVIKMNKKVYIIIIVLIVIMFIPILLYVTFYKTNNSTYLILPGNEIYTLESGKLNKVNDEIKKPLDIVFISDEEKKLTFTYKSNQILFYEDDEPIIIPDSFKVAYSNKKNLNLVDYKIENINSENLPKFSDILKKHDIIGYDYLTTSEKLSYDFDNDGKNEELYFVSNLFEELKYDKVFSFVYYIKDDEIIYLQEDVIESENAYDICVSDINSIIDISGNKIMTITCEYFSEIGDENNIYNYQKSKFNQLN